MPRTPAPLPNHLRRQPFVLAKALADGVAPGRLYAPDLARPTSGVRCSRAPQTTLDRAQAFALVLPDDAMFTHQTGTEILGLPLPRRLQGGPLHVSTPSERALVRRKGVRGHRGAERRRRLTVHGLPVGAPEDLLVDLAPALTVVELVQLGDAVLARSDEYVEHIKGVLVRRAGDRGMGRLKSAMALMRRGTASPMETLCRLKMREFGLPVPLLNQDIYDATGEWIACVDFCWPEQRVIVEYDGEEVHSDPSQRRKDAARRRQITREHWTVIVVTSDDLAGSDEWLRDLQALLT